MDIQRKKTNQKAVTTLPKKSSALRSYSRSIRVIGITWIVVLVAVAGSLTYSIVYADETIPGTRLVGKSASSLTRQELQDRIAKDTTAWQSKEWEITYKKKTLTAHTDDLGITFLPQETFDAIWAAGHNGRFFRDLANQIHGITRKNEQGLAYQINLDTLHDFLKKQLGDTIVEPIDAKLSIDDGVATLTPSELGRKMDLELLSADITSTLREGSAPTLVLRTYEAEPRITSAIAQLTEPEINQLSRENFTLRYQDKSWTIEPAEMRSWMTMVPAELKASREAKDAEGVDMHLTLIDGEQPEVTLTDATSGLVNTLSRSSLTHLTKKIPGARKRLGIRANMAAQFGIAELNANEDVFLAPVLVKKDVADSFDVITKNIDVKGKNAHLSFVDGKIVVKEPSQNGRTVDRDKAISDILSAVQNNTSRDIALVVTESRAAVTEDNYKKLGITELISQGESNFAGSHAARIHNVLTTVSRFDGVLVAPGEEFSFVEFLGDVDASTGYLPELVIKGKKITKEYGGGVCQVSSTVFRAAVYAGLDITERRNHSFVVSYYGEPGRDATIYIPHPDLKFVNNTPGYILMQPHVEGTKLTFDFFGTSDGREVKTEGPYIYDRRAGNAMKTSWTQIVMRDGKEVSRETYLSNYKPVTDFTRE